MLYVAIVVVGFLGVSWVPPAHIPLARSLLPPSATAPRLGKNAVEVSIPSTTVAIPSDSTGTADSQSPGSTTQSTASQSSTTPTVTVSRTAITTIVPTTGPATSPSTPTDTTRHTGPPTSTGPPSSSPSERHHGKP